MSALEDISRQKPVIFPLHPRTRKAISLLNLRIDNMHIIDPVGYFDMLEILRRCNAVFTDSGGLQKESFFSKKLCVTLREETEWQELVENGFNIIAGTSKESIANAERSLASKKVDWNRKLYGDGNAGEKIVKGILEIK